MGRFNLGVQRYLGCAGFGGEIGWARSAHLTQQLLLALASLHLSRRYFNYIDTLPPLASVVALGVALSSRPVVIGCLFLPLTLLVVLACWFLFGVSTSISLLSADFCITPADHAIVGVVLRLGAASGLLGLP